MIKNEKYRQQPCLTLLSIIIYYGNQTGLTCVASICQFCFRSSCFIFVLGTRWCDGFDKACDTDFMLETENVRDALSIICFCVVVLSPKSLIFKYSVKRMRKVNRIGAVISRIRRKFTYSSDDL